ncbi:unnamed protein product [Caenorhabditis auriculariae]|uniref:DUF19 domain-containing protein n=1 Tax=Caenorhabditis auriculariae TaxID=2777116 RepID=A0A8S1HB55_9PELO|nr:unnamed protein product [Caenorhabditis auriculariae]
MKTALVLLLVGVFAHNLIAQQTCSSDQSNQAKGCFQTWLGNYNISSQVTFQNFISARLAFFNATGQSGFDQSCVWQLALDTCLQGVDLNSCLTQASFANWFGSTPNDSYEFRTFYYVGDYQCTDGRKVLSQNWNCIMKVDTYEATDLQSCWNTYIAATNSGADVCKAYNQYINCMDSLYSILCGPAVRPYMCQMDEIGFEVNYGGCNKTLQHCF